MLFSLLIIGAIGQEIVPLVYDAGDINDQPWKGAYDPNGTIPASGSKTWLVRLQDNDLPDWVFEHDNATSLSINVIKTCNFNMTFAITNSHKGSDTTWSQEMNTTNKGAVAYCDVDSREYQIVVTNHHSYECDSVKMEVYIGVGEGVCILESLAKWWLKTFLIILFVSLGICVLLCVLAVCCGCTSIYMCCCRKKPDVRHYDRMQNQNNYNPAPITNQQNFAPNQPYYQPQQQQQAYQPQQSYQPQQAYPANQGYVQQPYQPHQSQQNNTTIQDGMPYTEHV